MAIDTREVVMYARKATVSTIKLSYRSICAHPYIWSMLFFILLLSRAFPSLFSFLVSSSPVIACTAILLGTLLSYGSPNITEIEEEDKKTQKISSMQTESAVDDIFVKKDESFTVETHLETSTAAAAGTSNSATGEKGCDVPFAKMYDEGYGGDNAILTTSSLLHGEMKETHGVVKVMKEGEATEREFSVNDQNVEGLTVQIAKIASDSPFDSSLGSPWQPVHDFDVSSGSVSDGAESSSPDASMADIIPMLDELDNPLLKSKHSRGTHSSNENSDSSSSGSSQDHELEEVENKGNEIEESQEIDDPNEVAVAWNENDQNNVMDLGYSEIERNRRLENLIARRRLRKLQRYVTEKNLIDLDSLYPTSIPSISAPRWNPFDYDYGGNLNLPPIPGSAPSVMQPRNNPFDLSYDHAEEINTISREYLGHHDFLSAVQRDVPFQKHESITVGPSVFGDFSQENEDSKLIEPELHQGSIMLLSPVSHDVDHVEQDKQSSGATTVVNDHAVELNTSVSVEETHLSANSLSVMEGEIRDGENILPASDARKLEVGEGSIGDSSTLLSPEADEHGSRVNSYEEPANLEEKSCDSMQSKPGDDASASNPVYDSGLSAMGKSIPNISTYDETFIYDCTENVISNSLPSDAQVALPQRPSEAYVSLEDRDLLAGEDSALGIVEMPESSGDVPPLAAIAESDDEKVINVLPSIDEPAMHLLHEARNEDSRVSSLDLLSATEEKLVEDRKSVLQSPTSSDSTATQVVEESNVHMLDVKQATSICQKAAEEIGHDDFGIGLVPEEKSSDALVEPLIIPAHEDKFPGSEFVESMEFSSISDMMLKHEMGTVDDSGDSQRTIPNDIFNENEGGFLGNLSNADEELGGEVHGEVSRLADIDEGLLSELDAVGDFRAEREFKIEQEGSNQGVGQLDTIFEEPCAESQDSRVSPTKYDASPIGEDPELTGYNSRLHVVEACSFDELDSVFKQHRDESAPPSMSDFTIEDSVTSESKMVPSELGITDKNLVIADTDTEMLVLEAKSVDDISAALKHVSEGLDKPDIFTAETLDVLPEQTHLEAAEQTISDLHVVEAKCLEDIDLALKQQSEVNVESHPWEEKHENVLTETMASKIEPEPEVVDVPSPEASERNLEIEHDEMTHLEAAEETISDLHVVEAKCLEDINLALKQQSEVNIKSHPGERKHENVLTETMASQIEPEPEVIEVHSSEASDRNLEPEPAEIKPAEEIKLDSVDQRLDISDGNENVANVSGTSTSRMDRKKNSDDSGSDSSSSSSSSSSDSE